MEAKNRKESEDEQEHEELVESYAYRQGWLLF